MATLFSKPASPFSGSPRTEDCQALSPKSPPRCLQLRRMPIPWAHTQHWATSPRANPSSMGPTLGMPPSQQCREDQIGFLNICFPGREAFSGKDHSQARSQLTSSSTPEAVVPSPVTQALLLPGWMRSWVSANEDPSPGKNLRC